MPAEGLQSFPGRAEEPDETVDTGVSNVLTTSLVPAALRAEDERARGCQRLPLARRTHSDDHAADVAARSVRRRQGAAMMPYQRCIERTAPRGTGTVTLTQPEQQARADRRMPAAPAQRPVPKPDKDAGPRAAGSGPGARAQRLPPEGTMLDRTMRDGPARRLGDLHPSPVVEPFGWSGRDAGRCRLCRLAVCGHRADPLQECRQG